MRQADRARQLHRRRRRTWTGQTGLAGAFTIPGWAQDGGREAMLKRFADPAQRARIVKEAEEAMTARFGGPAGVYLPSMSRS